MSDGPELTSNDVKEILRLIDESELDQVEIDTPRFSVRFDRGGAGARAAAPAGDAPVQVPDSELVEVVSPTVGTFYRAPSPGADPFVEVGSRVDPQTQVCLVEVMKLMSSVVAGAAGVIAEVCAANGAPVQYDDVLFRIQTDV